MSVKVSKAQFYTKVASLVLAIGQAKESEAKARAELERMLSKGWVDALESRENREICKVCNKDFAEEQMHENGRCMECEKARRRRAYIE